MINITVIKKKETANNFVFDVQVSESSDTTIHKVTLDKSYFARLGGKSAENLIKRSFEFLLEREPKESILGEFNLSLIQQYFGEYEDEIKL